MRSICAAVLFMIGAHAVACAAGEEVKQTTPEWYGDQDGGMQDAAMTSGSGGTTSSTGGTTYNTGGTVVTGGTTATGGTSGASGSGGAATTGGAGGMEPGCPAGRKKCGGLCVPPAPAIGCNLTDCDPCPEDPNGVTTCMGESCSLTCNDGYALENGVCAAPVACTNNILDGTETDLDCGGDTCPPCEPGKICTADSDCDRGPCESGVCGCTPATCDTACGGVVDDGCGGTVDCSSSCPGGQVCFQNTCCEPVPCAQDACETTDDGCGGTVDCGSCQNGVCLNGTCCNPITPQECGADQCGTTDDGCGGTVDCGSTCSNGRVCYNDACCTPQSCSMSGCGYQSDGCGGVACPLCPSGDACDNANDCQSNSCSTVLFGGCGLLLAMCCD